MLPLSLLERSPGSWSPRCDRRRCLERHPLGQYMDGGILGYSQLQTWLHPPMSPVSSIGEEHMLPLLFGQRELGLVM